MWVFDSLAFKEDINSPDIETFKKQHSWGILIVFLSTIQAEQGS